MEIAHRLLLNDGELQHLYLSSDSTTQTDVLVQARSSSHNTHLAHVYFRNFKGGGSLPLLLEATSSLPSLQSLLFHCTEIPMALLAQVLSPTKLTTLKLRYCKLKYENEHEWKELETVLRQNQTLHDICVECCEWQVEEDTLLPNEHYSLFKLSSLLRAIAVIPTLQHLECVLFPSNRQRLPAPTLQCLGQIPRLQSLRVRHVWLPQPDVALLCHSVTKFLELQRLMLSCDMGPTSASALGHLLQDSPNLEHLALRIDRLEDSDSPVLLAQALHHHCHLRHFQLSGKAASELSTSAKMAFRDLMQTNISLEFVRLEINDYALQAEISFYLQLNHKGRRALLQELQENCCLQKREEKQESTCWVQALCRIAGDVRALHYYLTLNPSLFATAALEALLQKESESETDAKYHHNSQAQKNMYEWDAEDGIVYDSDGW